MIEIDYIVWSDGYGYGYGYSGNGNGYGSGDGDDYGNGNGGYDGSSRRAPSLTPHKPHDL